MRDELIIDFLRPHDIRPLYPLLCLRDTAPSFDEWERAANDALNEKDTGMLVARDLGGRLVGYCLYRQLESPLHSSVLVATDLFAADPINPAPVRAALQAHLAALARKGGQQVAAATR